MTCENCGSDVTQFDGGYVCSECQSVIVEGSITGWQVLSEELIA